MNTKNYPSNISKVKIFTLSLPIFFSNLAIPLVGIVDTGLMGNLGQSKYLASTSIATAVMTMIIWSFGFLRMGTVGLVAQLYGKSDYREIIKILVRNFLIATFLSVIIISLSFWISHAVENFFKIEKETLDLANTYISIRVFSIPAEFTIYILIGFYLGIQKTKISSLIIIILSIMNIIFSSYLVLSLNLDVAGVSFGTLISSYLTAIIFCLFTYRFISREFQITPNFNNLFVSSKFLRLFKINFDIFIRTILLTFAFLWIPYVGSKFGEDYLAANAILIQFVFLSSFFLDAYAYSTEGIVGFTIGRKNKKSFLLVVKNSIQLSVFTGIIISLIFLLFFKQIINIMTDIEIIRFVAYQHAYWIILIPPIASLCYQLDGIFIGASQTKEIRNAMIMSVITFMVLSIYFSKLYGNHGLWLSIILFMMIRSISLKIFFNKILKRF